MHSQDDRSVLISATGLSKSYRVWNSPSARLKAPLRARLTSLFGQIIEKDSSKYYTDFVALDSVDLSLRKGECLGVVGRNGSGKSTLLKILSGILQPSAGEYAVNGKVAALLELGTGFSEDFTGRENVYMNAAIYGVPRKQIDQDFDSIEDFAGIGAYMDQKVRTYSSGMVVRLAFSVLVHLKPDILIIDEALAVGDGAFVQKCMRWLKHFVKQHTAILVSHDMSAITQFCNRAIWIEKGKVAYSGSPKRTTEKYFETLYEQKDDASVETVEADVDTCENELEQALDSCNNTLEFFSFNPDAPSFGDYSARIRHVSLFDDSNQEVKCIQGGETVTVLVTAQADKTIQSPIIGFGVKNRQGQELFHENTALNSTRRGADPLIVAAGEEITARFTFRMPYFPSGDYYIFAAIATGVHEEHTQQHWIHEAVRFVATPNRIALGLIGLPMIRVSLDKNS